MTTYLSFEPVPAAKQLTTQFLIEATDLAQIIRRYGRNGIKISLYACALPNTYLAMISSHNDSLLMRLGELFDFPRGFPILWIPGSTVRYFGFYPKFGNDERQEPTNLREFDGVTRIEFFKKWSGFLAQLLVFQVNGSNYWTVCSKNSANPSFGFVTDAKRLFEPYICDELVTDMIARNLHICAETMSKQDQTHGARVLHETPIITAIGSGKTSVNSGAIAGKFVDFVDHRSLVDFCVKHRLPCDSAIVVTKEPLQFITELSANRDQMTDTLLNQILQRYEIEAYQGTIDHQTVLGNCLEGLVIRFYYVDRMLVKKYKFPAYTVRTMLLRPTFSTSMLPNRFISSVDKFVANWCVTAAGRAYWKNFAIECFQLYADTKMSDSLIGTHILVADAVTSMRTDALVEKFSKCLLAPKPSVIICVGPIGSGKSTLGARFQSNSGFKHIDGDILGIGADITSRLFRERSDYTRWLVIKTLMSGHTPVLSTGGGVLFSQNKQCTFLLQKQIQTVLNLHCDIIVCVMTDHDCITVLDKNFDVDTTYQSDTVKSVVRTRLETGEWPMPATPVDKFIDMIAKKSAENKKFAAQLLSHATHIFALPSRGEPDLKPIIDLVVQPEVSIGTFSQIRLLTMIDNQCGHITWLFDADSKIQFSLDDFASLESRYDPIILGVIHNMTSDKHRISFAVPDKAIHSDGSTHITINAGSHPPKEMRTATIALQTETEMIKLPNHSGVMIDYPIASKQTVPCQIQVIAAFGI